MYKYVQVFYQNYMYHWILEAKVYVFWPFNITSWGMSQLWPIDITSYRIYYDVLTHECYELRFDLLTYLFQVGRRRCEWGRKGQEDRGGSSQGQPQVLPPHRSGKSCLSLFSLQDNAIWLWFTQLHWKGTFLFI